MLTISGQCSLKRVVNKYCPQQIQTFTNGDSQDWPIDLYDGDYMPN